MIPGVLPIEVNNSIFELVVNVLYTAGLVSTVLGVLGGFAGIAEKYSRAKRNLES